MSDYPTDKPSTRSILDDVEPTLTQEAYIESLKGLKSGLEELMASNNTLHKTTSEVTINEANLPLLHENTIWLLKELDHADARQVHQLKQIYFRGDINQTSLRLPMHFSNTPVGPVALFPYTPNWYFIRPKPSYGNHPPFAETVTLAKEEPYNSIYRRTIGDEVHDAGAYAMNNSILVNGSPYFVTTFKSASEWVIELPMGTPSPKAILNLNKLITTYQALGIHLHFVDEAHEEVLFQTLEKSIMDNVEWEMSYQRRPHIYFERESKPWNIETYSSEQSGHFRLERHFNPSHYEPSSSRTLGYGVFLPRDISEPFKSIDSGFESALSFNAHNHHQALSEHFLRNTMWRYSETDYYEWSKRTKQPLSGQESESIDMKESFDTRYLTDPTPLQTRFLDFIYDIGIRTHIDLETRTMYLEFLVREDNLDGEFQTKVFQAFMEKFSEQCLNNVRDEDREAIQLSEVKTSLLKVVPY